MSASFILPLMIFCHIVDDYYLQGILASMKQKSWWQTNASNKMYRCDFIIALFMHSFSWAFMIMLPIAFYYHFEPSTLFYRYMVENVLIHACVDHCKANRKSINLVTDQIIHIVQILITYFGLISN